MAFVEDLSPFFNDTEFAVTATYNGNIPVKGILDLAYVDPFGNIEGRAPVFMCAESSVPSVRHGDTLDASGRNYKVVGAEPDGTGVVTLRLERQ